MRRKWNWKIDFVNVDLLNSKLDIKTRYNYEYATKYALQRRHNERDVVSNHQLLECLLDRLFRRRSKKTSKLRATWLCEGNTPVTDDIIMELHDLKYPINIKFTTKALWATV